MDTTAKQTRKKQMTITAIQSIKKDYAPCIDSFEADKQKLLAKRAELLQASQILFAHGICTLDVDSKIREIEEKYNFCVSELEIIEEEIDRQIKEVNATAKREREQQAFQDGILAYETACNDGSYSPICNYKAKYLKQQWVKGVNFMASTNGAIGQNQFAA